MMRLDCTTDKYGALYARWLDNPTPLLDYADATDKDVVLDLCGGTGIVALAARERGCTAALLDRNPRCGDPYVVQVADDAENADVHFDEGTFTLVVCRQALGYLQLRATARAVRRVLTPDGRFVFNTFREPRWALKAYRRGGAVFVEASGFFRHTVFHLQASPLIGLDVTKFRWHTHQQIVQAMSPYFDVGYDLIGRSARYLCRAKELTDA
jgi:SAM-dependent methyltransferase